MSPTPWTSDSRSPARGAPQRRPRDYAEIQLGGYRYAAREEWVQVQLEVWDSRRTSQRALLKRRDVMILVAGVELSIAQEASVR